MERDSFSYADTLRLEPYKRPCVLQGLIFKAEGELLSFTPTEQVPI
jgi:hypothetical protein